MQICELEIIIFSTYLIGVHPFGVVHMLENLYEAFCFILKKWRLMAILYNATLM